MPETEEDAEIADETSEERLYGLIEIAERQQNVAQTALEGMVKERIALGQELQRFSNGLKEVQDDIRLSAVKAIEETRSSAEESGAAVAQGAIDSLQAMLDDVAHEAERTEATLRGVSDWLSWRLLWLGLAAVVSLCLFWWLASCALLWWDTSAIGQAQVRKVQLQAEIARLVSNRDMWVDAGMEGKLSRCGPKKRACVKVDENAGSFGDKSDYRVIQND